VHQQRSVEFLVLLAEPAIVITVFLLNASGRKLYPVLLHRMNRIVSTISKAILSLLDGREFSQPSFSRGSFLIEDFNLDQIPPSLHELSNIRRANILRQIIKIDPSILINTCIIPIFLPPNLISIPKPDLIILNHSIFALS
jgi:hypothetical protein